MSEHISISNAARALGRFGVDISPQNLSDLFYRRKLDEALAPMVAGRRLVDPSRLQVIADRIRELRQPKEEVASA